MKSKRDYGQKFFCKPGRKLHVEFFDNPGAIYKIHVLAVVDEYYVVYRFYGVHKQWWHYRVEYWDKVKTMYNNAKELKEERKA